MAAKIPGGAPTAIGLTRYVHFGFLAGCAVITYVLIKLIESLWAILLPSNQYAVVGIAVIIAGAVTLYCWRHPKINMLAKEIATELSKVTWPTRKETSAFTITVIVTTIIASTILGLFDMFWATLTGLVYR
jgi:preprotein translocase subunit SecE